jgi:hypothetical protein
VLAVVLVGLGLLIALVVEAAASTGSARWQWLTSSRWLGLSAAEWLMAAAWVSAAAVCIVGIVLRLTEAPKSAKRLVQNPHADWRSLY